MAIHNKTAKLTISDTNGRIVSYSPDGKTLVCGDTTHVDCSKKEEQ